MKEPWLVTKELFLREPRTPPLTESKLRRPAFRTVLELLKCTMANTGFAKGLFTDEELSYQSYTTLDQEFRFVDRVVEFLGKFVGKRIDVNPVLVVKARGGAEDAHVLLQTFSKLAHTSKPSASAVKATKKEPILTGEKENNMSYTKKPAKTQVNFKEESASTFKTESMKPIVDESEAKVLETEIVRLQREKNFSASEISRLNNDISDLKGKITQATKDIEEAKKENKNLESTSVLKENISQIKANIETINSEIREIGAEIEGLLGKLKEREEQEDPEAALRKEYDALLEVNKKLEREFIASNNDFKLVESQELEKTVKRGEKDSEISRLKEQKDSLLETLKSYKQEKELMDLKKESTRKSEEVKDMTELISKLKEEVQTLKSQSPKKSPANSQENASPAKEEHDNKVEEITQVKVKEEMPRSGETPAEAPKIDIESKPVATSEILSTSPKEKPNAEETPKFENKSVAKEPNEDKPKADDNEGYEDDFES